MSDTSLRAYSIHHGNPWDGAALVFAFHFRQAKLLGFRRAACCDGADFIDIRGHWIRDDAWLKANGADQEKLAAGVPHVIDSPPTCNRCELWGDELFDGYCEGCADEIEDEQLEGVE